MHLLLPLAGKHGPRVRGLTRDGSRPLPAQSEQLCFLPTQGMEGPTPQAGFEVLEGSPLLTLHPEFLFGMMKAFWK